MPRRWAISRIIVVVLSAGVALRAQELTPAAAEANLAGGHGPAVIDEIAFVGLRRISPEAVKNQMSTQSGDALAAARLDRDVRALARLGWFETVRVETSPIADAPESPRRAPPRVRLTFYVPESPILTGIEYTGSRLLSRAQIEKLLADKNLKPRLGEPENAVTLEQIRKKIDAALAELGHPEARVRMRREESAQATVRVRFEISDGPHLPAGRVTFEGHPELPARLLRRQMRRVTPGAWLAGMRGRNIYTREAFAEDRERILAYYQNHGYPEARAGEATVSRYEEASRRWWPWPHTTRNEKLSISVPIEAGSHYRFGAVEPSAELQRAAGIDDGAHGALPDTKIGQEYSARAVETARRVWEARARSRSMRKHQEFRAVQAMRTPDAATRTIRIRLDLSNTPPYTVERLEFHGLRHFPDRYLRKRIPLREGAPFDERALEAGLARLARSGYFKPIKKEDIEVQPNEAAHTVNVVIRVEELGEQRVSLVGGRGQFGSTLGIAYTLFNLLDREELLSSRIEGGPESVQLALGFAKEGFLGSRGTLALSVFNTFLRPYLAGSVKGPFLKEQSQGVNGDWSYAATNFDVLSVDYGLSRTKTQYPLTLPAGLTGLPSGEVKTESSSHSVGFGWTRNTGDERVVLADSVSGGWLGGSENVVRSKAEYARIFRDAIFDRQNAWAFRTSFLGAGSYMGNMPPTSRLFAGDEYVRGLRSGELGPEAVISSAPTSAATSYSTTPTGANLIGAANAEYRVPLAGGTEAAGFFDAGSGWLLPNWLGQWRPSLLSSTNGVLHGSTGLELRWTVPGIGVQVRAYYALNVLRLDRRVLLPDGSLLRAHDRFSALGWGLGSLF
jgi:outer membrane protein insertion porin family